MNCIHGFPHGEHCNSIWLDQVPRRMRGHDVKCKKFPDPFDERDPVGPCNCGFDSQSSGEVNARGT